MTTGQLVKSILKFFKDHPKCIPMRRSYISVLGPQEVSCCGLGAAYLAANPSDNYLHSILGSCYRPSSLVWNWLFTTGINPAWCSGFIHGFDSPSRSAPTTETPQYRKGHIAGRAVSLRLFDKL